MEVGYGLSSKIAFQSPTGGSGVQKLLKEERLCPNTSPSRWVKSPTNPAKLPKSLATDGTIQWRIDGSCYTSTGGQSFYALPITLLRNGALPPSNINVDIFQLQGEKSVEKLDATTRKILDLPAARAAEGPEINRFAVSRFLRRVLSRWADGMADFNGYYRKLPYGSSIQLYLPDRKDFAGKDLDETSVKVVFPPAAEFTFSHPRLRSAPRIRQKSKQIPIISIEWLTIEKTVHDTVSLVKIPCLTGDRLWVFKTNRPTKLSWEIENILILADHSRQDSIDARFPHAGGFFWEGCFEVQTEKDPPRIANATKLVASSGASQPESYGDDTGDMGNVIAEPAYLVTRSSWLKSKDVFGMILEYHPKGNLASVLDERRTAGTLDFKTKFKWAQQLVKAVLDIAYSRMGYHGAIRPNNILVNNDDSLRIIDMEQGGNWGAFSGPEISYRVDIRAVAVDEHLSVGERTRGRYLELVRNSKSRQSMTWQEHTMAEVYSIGKVLWCIFEEWSHTKNGRGEAWFIPIDHGCEFPNFSHRTPKEVARLIRDCVAGSEDLSGYKRLDDDLVLLDGVMYPKGRTGRNGEPRATAEETVTFAKEMYLRSFKMMEEYMLAKARCDEEEWNAGAAKGKGRRRSRDAQRVGIDFRPDLLEVLERLHRLETKYIRE